MVDEVVMEKKLSRSVQSQKGNPETKKNSDVSVSKVFSKYAKKREASCSKFEQFKKSNHVTKRKHITERTSSRAYNYENGGKNAELTEEIDEYYNVRGNKKQNLTHLLNFHCKPREGSQDVHYYVNSKASSHNSIKNMMITQKHKYNKEHFLQANCQFVVKIGEDYSIYMASPDILVNWDLIEQIRFFSSELVNCPICLYFPKVSKITRCGHIYCWSCILHYLALTDGSWHKCPICFEPIRMNDLKSVKILNQIQYNTGNEITFQLMKRERNCTVVIPVSETTTRISSDLLSVSELKYSLVYSKLLVADNQDILKIIKNEEYELDEELQENKDCPELCFVQQAIHLLEDRKRKLFLKSDKFEDIPCCSNSVQDSIHYDSIIKLNNELSSLEISDDLQCNRKLHENINSNSTDISISTVEYKNSSRHSLEENINNSRVDMFNSIVPKDLELVTHSTPFKYYYFYQAIDGQQIFLHPINVRMLEKQYGSLEKCPPILKGDIVEIESGSMTEKLRERLRYLQHLPVTCHFQMIEINLQPPLISNEILICFKDQLESRKNLRMKRAKEEKKIEKKAEILANKQYGRYSPHKHLKLDSWHHFPRCGADTPPHMSLNSPASSRASSPLPDVNGRSVSPSYIASDSSTTLLNNNTFAEKLKDTATNRGWKKREITPFDDSNSAHSSNLISDIVEAALLKARKEKNDNKETTSKQKRKKKQKSVPLCSVGIIYSND